VKRITRRERYDSPGEYIYRFDLWLPRHEKWFCSNTYVNKAGNPKALQRLQYAANALGVEVGKLDGDFDKEIAIKTFTRQHKDYNGGKPYSDVDKFLPADSVSEMDVTTGRACKKCWGKVKRPRDMFASDGSAIWSVNNSIPQSGENQERGDGNE